MMDMDCHSPGEHEGAEVIIVTSCLILGAWNNMQLSPRMMSLCIITISEAQLHAPVSSINLSSAFMPSQFSQSSSLKNLNLLQVVL